MNDQMNAPTSPAPSGPASFFQVWTNALTKPNEQTFADMAASGNAKATTAYLWVFVGSLVQFFLSSLVENPSMRRLMEQFGNTGGVPVGGGGFVGRLVVAVCGAPIIAVIATLFFAIGVYIIQWIAKMFGGRGTPEQLAYTLAAITAPYSIIVGILSLFGAIPYVGFCFSAILAIAGLYALVLEVMAVKGVNQFGWGAAIASLLIPGLVIGLVCGCLVAVGVVGVMRLLGPQVGNALP